MTPFGTVLMRAAILALLLQSRAFGDANDHTHDVSGVDAAASPVAALDQSVLLRVELLSRRSTDYTSDCLEADEAEGLCLEWSHWTVMEGRVKQVIEGEFAGDTVQFGLYMHGLYANRVIADAFVFLQPFDNRDTIRKLGVELFAEDILFPFDVLCITDERLPALNNPVFKEEPDLRTDTGPCYSTGMFADSDVFDDCSVRHLEDEAALTTCEAKALTAAQVQLVQLESTIRTRIVQSGRPAHEARDRRTALRAFQRSNRDFQRMLKSTCAAEFRIDAIGRELGASDRQRMQFPCKYRLVNERVRILRQHQWLDD